MSCCGFHCLAALGDSLVGAEAFGQLILSIKACVLMFGRGALVDTFSRSPT